MNEKPLGMRELRDGMGAVSADFLQNEVLGQGR